MMEEEYRMQKAQAEGKHHSSASEKVIHEDGTVSSPRRGDSLQGQKADRADDDASTRGVVSPTQSAPDEDGQGAVNDTDSETLANADGLPTIRISTESAREQAAAAAKEANGHGEPKENGIKESAGNALEKPVQAAENNQDGEGGQGPSQEPFSFSNKRLCERWLDNLFMVLYEVGTLRSTHYVPYYEWPLTLFIGLTSVDHLPRRGRALQDAACCIQEDGP